MNTEKVPVVVHLVHGTWPYGFLCRPPIQSNSARSKAYAPLSNFDSVLMSEMQSPTCEHRWFEEGSSFRDEITQMAGDDIQINYQIFEWSGKNSYAARESAAKELRTHLRQSIAENPKSEHVIIAHSHGGTISAEALSSSESSDLRTVISWVACMATPFTYAVAAPKEHFNFFVFSLFLVILPLQLYLSHTTHGIIPLIIPAIPLAFFIYKFVGLSRPSKYLTSPEIGARGNVRFFQLRATRDEASLVIGLAQSLNWLMASPIQWLEGGWIARVKLLMVTLLLCLVFFYAGQHLPLSQFWKVFSMNLPTAVVGAFYLIGYSLVALSVGFDDIRSWPCTTVEVDSAPQGWPVTMINLAEGTDPNDVRHSIHNRQGARRKLANMLREGSFT